MHSHQHCALLLLGHGSTVNPDSSEPTFRHAAALREQGLFAEVQCAFWKEQPNFREIWSLIEAEEVYVVPVFISEGYFCQEVLPRELGLTGPVTRHSGKTIRYCAPVGSHPAMQDLLLRRADEVAPGVPRDQVSLVIVGHGTSLNDNSTAAIKDQVRLIRESPAGFAEVVDAYMEEAPFVAEWDQLTSAPHVVVVPFFISDGLHSYQDIPVLLGMETEPTAAASQSEVFRRNPYDLRNRILHYSSAIGTEPQLSRVIMEQVEAFDRNHPESLTFPGQSIMLNSGGAAFLGELLAGGVNGVGEIRIIAQEDNTFRVCHHLDAVAENGNGLQPLATMEDAREMTQYTADGEYRPLKSATGLKRGWAYIAKSLSELHSALEVIYPGSVGHYRGNSLTVEAARTTLKRQTGLYRNAKRITSDGINEVVAALCSQTCLRHRLWEPEGQSNNDVPAPINNVWPMLCGCACSLFIEECRKKEKTESKNIADMKNIVFSH